MAIFSLKIFLINRPGTWALIQKTMVAMDRYALLYLGKITIKNNIANMK